MALDLDPYAQCPCESGNKVKWCCRPDGKRWRARRILVEMKPLGPTGASREGCYAAELADCGASGLEAKRSSEHFVSEALLTLLHDSVITLSGAPWLKPGEMKKMPISGMASNVLCVRHNGSLSPLDRAAGRFFAALKRFAVMPDGKPPEGPDRAFLISGDAMERWFLKVLCGAVASGQFAKGGVPTKMMPPRGWLDMIWGQQRFERGRGLYVSRWEGAGIESFEQIQFTVTVQGDRVWCLSMMIFGIAFHLIVDEPPTPLSPKLQAFRPGQFQLIYPNRKDTLILAWDDDDAHEDLKLYFKSYRKFDQPLP
jgi:hypothetical protein